MDTTTITSFLQEASISVFTVGALVYIVYMFIKYIQEERRASLEIINKQSESHHQTMKEHSEAFRGVEKEMRTMLTTHIEQSNVALRENTEALKRSAEVNERFMRMKRYAVTCTNRQQNRQRRKPSTVR